MPMIFEMLQTRARSAEATALDTIAAAARAVAAGGTADIDAVEKASTTIVRALRSLRLKGFVEVVRRGARGCGSNWYRLRATPEG